ncbi:MAG TPA: VWA domain-containing protein [Thermoanaerobaculia bacterium]|nr:VWA domain-containing protein [Thermoanaerobaculia bacterium]
MTSFRVHCLAAILLSLGAVPGLAQEYGELVEVNLVTVDIEARDAKGQLVTDLERGDFRVFEDGHRMEVTNFSPVARPATAIAAAPTADAAAPVTAPDAPGTTAEATSRIVVYVDNMHLHAGSRSRALSQVRGLLASELVAGEQVMVATEDGLGMTVRLPFSSDPAAVAAAFDQLATLATHAQEDDHTRAAAVQAVVVTQQQDIAFGIPCAPNIADAVKAFAESSRQDVRRTLSRLGYLVNSLAGLPGRKALLYVSDGIPLQPGQELFEVLYNLCGGGAATAGPWMPDELAGFDSTSIGPGAYRAQSAALDAASYDVTNDLRRLAAHASSNRVSFYTLQAAGLTNPASAEMSMSPEDRLLQAPSVAAIAAENPKASLVYLAHETGGRAIVDTNDFRRELGRLREDLASFYSLGYAPKHQGEGKEHRIEVKVDRPGVRLTYRRVYRDKPVLEQAVDHLLASLMHGFEDNPLGVTIEMLPTKPLANGHLLVTARLLVPLFKLATIARGDFHEAKLRVLVIAGAPGSETSGVRQVEVPLRVPHQQALTAFGKSYAYEVGLELTAGRHDVAFAVRDELGATTSFLRRRLQVTAPTAVPPSDR